MQYNEDTKKTDNTSVFVKILPDASHPKNTQITQHRKKPQVIVPPKHLSPQLCRAD